MAEPTFEQIRFHTPARRVPQLIGKLPGWKIPGGPYTVAQFSAFAAIVYLGWQGWSLWPTQNVFMKVAGIAAAGVCVVFAMRALPAAPMSLVHQVAGMWSVATAPAWGRVAGRSVGLGRPHSFAYGRITWTSAPRLSPTAHEARQESAHPSVTPLTGVQRLLAADISPKETS